MGKIFRQIHIELSLFFLPLALLYVFSGAFYLSGFNQDSGAKIWKFNLPLVEKNQLPQVLNDVLAKNGLRSIEDKELKKGKNQTLVLGGVNYSATLTKGKEAWDAKIVQRSFMGNLMMLHKGKGKWYFDVLAFAFAFSLLLFYFSGLIMTKFCNKRRKQAFLTLFLGTLLVFIVGYMSV